MYIGVAVSVVLSIALYLLVEQPVLRGLGKAKTLVAALVAASVALAASPTAVAAIAADERDYANVRRTNYGLSLECSRVFTGVVKDVCRTQPEPKVAIWGDSYAMAWTSVLMGPLAEHGLEQTTRGACDPLYGMSRFPIVPGTYNRETAQQCIENNDAILNYLASQDNIETVLIAGRLTTILSQRNLMLVQTDDGFTEKPTSLELATFGLSEAVRFLHEAGKKVAILSPPPADGSLIGDCLEREARGKITFGGRGSCDLPLADVTKTREVIWGMIQAAADANDVPVISMDDFLCDETTCKASIDGTFIYRDAGHLTYEGAALIGQQSDVASRVLSEPR
jgi:hypothetical protein